MSLPAIFPFGFNLIIQSQLIRRGILLGFYILVSQFFLQLDSDPQFLTEQEASDYGLTSEQTCLPIFLFLCLRLSISSLKAADELFIFQNFSVDLGGDSMSIFLVINFIKSHISQIINLKMEPIPTTDEIDQLEQEEQNNKYQNMDKFKMNTIISVAAVSITFTLICCYFISELKVDFIKIFPRQCITHTARHYPQAIFFRLGMISNAYHIAFIFLVFMSWIQKQAQRIKYKWINWSWLASPLHFGIFCEFLTVVTIDVDGTWILHRYSAYTFYLLLFSSLIFITLRLLKKMRDHDNTVISSFSYGIKCASCIYLIFLYVFAFIGIRYFETISKVVGSINEWLSLYILIIWAMSLTLDWNQLYVCFDVERMEFQIVRYREKIEENEMECQLFAKESN